MKLTIQQAIDLATDNGVIVSDYYPDSRRGKKITSFKCFVRDGGCIVVKQKERKSRTWTIQQKGVSAFYGSQSECIQRAIEELTK